VSFIRADEGIIAAGFFAQQRYDHMAKKHKRLSSKPVDALVGQWVSGHEWETEVEFTISKARGGFKVSALDRWDGESPEIYDVKATATALTFAAHWSTGRFTKYRVRPLDKNTIEMSFTHTATMNYLRKSAISKKAKK
jgi:hypothetical protein